MCRVRGAEAGGGVPADCRGIALDGDAFAVGIGVVADGDVVKILRVGATGCTQLIEGGVDEPEGMARHLVRDSHEGGPEGCAGTGAAGEAPLSALIEGETGQGIGISRNIGDATPVIQLALHSQG